MTDMQRREDCYQVPLRVLEELAENSARKAVEAATPEIAKQAAKLGVEIAFSQMQMQAGAGLFRLAKYTAIGALLLCASWLAILNSKLPG